MFDIPIETRTHLAAGLARLILRGDPTLLPTVADYGRTVSEGGRVTEQHRRGMSRALAQDTVCEHYARIVVDLKDDFPTRAEILRLTALYVYTRS